MKVANAELILSKVGSTIKLKDVTPAEVMLLVAEHRNEAGKQPVINLVEREEEVDRKEMDELNRLLGKYNIKKVKALFPGAFPKFPETFEEAIEGGQRAQTPSTRLLDHQMSF